MKYYNIDAIEISTIRSALLYAAEQVQSSDIPVFEDYVKNADMYQANKDKAEIALRLVKDIDKLDAEGYNWVAHTDDYSTLDVVAFHEDIGVYACMDMSCWKIIDSNTIMNLATGEVLVVIASETGDDGQEDKLYCHA